jgi:hypothetical protein
MFTEYHGNDYINKHRMEVSSLHYGQVEREIYQLLNSVMYSVSRSIFQWLLLTEKKHEQNTYSGPYAS